MTLRLLLVLALVACHGRADRADRAAPATDRTATDRTATDRTATDRTAARGTDAAAACPPLTLAIDGAPRTDLHGLAVTLVNGPNRIEQVELVSGAVGCAQALDNGFQLPADAVLVRAYYHPQAQGLGTEAHTEMVVPGVALVHAATGPGDTTTLCIAPTTFTPVAGTLTGKRVEIAGALTGSYCGALDLTP